MSKQQTEMQLEVLKNLIRLSSNGGDSITYQFYGFENQKKGHITFHLSQLTETGGINATWLTDEKYANLTQAQAQWLLDTNFVIIGVNGSLPRIFFKRGMFDFKNYRYALKLMNLNYQLDHDLPAYNPLAIEGYYEKFSKLEHIETSYFGTFESLAEAGKHLVTTRHDFLNCDSSIADLILEFLNFEQYAQTMIDNERIFQFCDCFYFYK